MVSLPSTTKTIFWPLGLQKSGFCYGWRMPICCVAGVLDAETEEEAARALDVACTAPAWCALQDTCGGKPEVIGYCEYDIQDNSVNIASWKVQPVLFLYHRHSLSSLRFYAFDASIFAPVSQFSSTGPSRVYAQLQAQDFTRPFRPDSQSVFNQITLNQLNASTLLEAAIIYPSARMLPAMAALLFSISTITTILSRPLHTISRIIGTVVKISVAPSTTLRDLCAVAQQIKVRTEQAEYFVAEIPHLRKRGDSDITNYAARYTRFFNTVWMILNDVTIGMAFGSFLTENASKLAQVTNTMLRKYLAQNIIFTLQWLDSWPAGLKLNTELSGFYSHIFVRSIQLWERCLEELVPYISSIIYTLGIMSSFGGLSLAISAIMDLVAISTIHIYVCYFFTGLIYHRMLKTAGSLFNLFRGKRYNVLRNRVDSWEYDMDQLLFGTILFTLLAFLFPTVLVYYTLFAIIRFTILLSLASMEFTLTLINHFPLFALMLSVKDSWRLPGGIYFRPTAFKTKHGVPPCTNLVVENHAVPLSLLFFQYVELSKVLARHYNPLRLAWCLLKGEYLGTISRFQMRYGAKEEAHA
ncbi:N-acetylglucosaminyl-phosphatidylinositol biosynthetic protein gpi1 [Leucoagaricus sp. SymC.cos]|nr:N-acetylglucosaminyl-phosphatidylinositol biosynthetic protein gpi1 [Leucoagaricus sp. SymC.cos]